MVVNYMSNPKHIPEENILTDEEYNHLVFVLGTQIDGVLELFNCYGLGSYIPGVKAELFTLAENFGQAVRGDKHKPIHVISEPLRRAV